MKRYSMIPVDLEALEPLNIPATSKPIEDPEGFWVSYQEAGAEITELRGDVRLLKRELDIARERERSLRMQLSTFASVLASAWSLIFIGDSRQKSRDTFLSVYGRIEKQINEALTYE